MNYGGMCIGRPILYGIHHEIKWERFISGSGKLSSGVTLGCIFSGGC